MARKPKKRIEKKVLIGDRRVSVYGFTAFEIQQKIEELEREEERKKFPLFPDIMDLWEEHHFAEIALGTQTCYKPAMKRAKEEFAETRLCDITAMDVSKLLKQLADLGYSHQTVKVQKVVIDLVFQFAQSRGLIDSNPAAHAEMPKKLPRSERECPDDASLKIVMQSADQPFGAFALFLLLTGCRRGEALGLLWGDFDAKGKTISINKKIVFDGNRAIIEHHAKTAAGQRVIAVPDVLCELLEQLRADASETDYIFGNGSTPYSEAQFRRRWNSYLKATGLSITPHQLRHAYATILYDARIDEKIAQSFMGHSKIEITRNVYTHIRQQRAAQAQGDINDFVRKTFAAG